MRGRGPAPWQALRARDLRARGYLSDTSAHDPNNITGTYKWNNPNAWGPAAAGFITPGQSYVDPVFSESVYRLTDYYNGGSPVQLTDEHYVHNHTFNADNTKMLLIRQPGDQVIAIPGGAVTHSGIPISLNAGDTAFSPVDPAVYYYLSGANLRKVTLQGGGTWTDVILKTFSGTLGVPKGRINWFDITGRYFLILLPTNQINVWDSQTDTLFSGAFTYDPGGNGGCGISPSGKHIIMFKTTGTTQAVGIYSRAVDLGGQSISATEITMYDLAAGPTPHAGVMSASDGKDYLVTIGNTIANSNKTAKFDCDVGKTSEVTFFQFNDGHSSHHVSPVAKGPHRDWCFYSMEFADGFDVAAAYSAYDNELVMVNVVTLEIRRLCHLRYRGTAAADTNGGYYSQPRVNTSWDGGIVLVTASHDIDMVASPGVQTTTTAQIIAGATTIPVVSTAGFPASVSAGTTGVSHPTGIGNGGINYTSKDATNLLGVTGVARTYESGSVVTNNGWGYSDLFYVLPPYPASESPAPSSGSSKPGARRKARRASRPGALLLASLLSSPTPYSRRQFLEALTLSGGILR